MALAEAPPAPTDNGAGPRSADHFASVDTSKYTLFSQGAEAVGTDGAMFADGDVPTACLASSPPGPFLALQRAWKGTFLGRPAVLKERFSKGYRHPTLDTRLTLHRTKAEMRGLLKARKLGVDTPVMYSADVKTGMMIQECVDGVSVREALQQDSLPNRDAILKAIGQCLAKMHDGGLIHGDLTTSNMLLRHKDQSLVRFEVDEYAGMSIVVFVKACTLLNTQLDSARVGDDRFWTVLQLNST